MIRKDLRRFFLCLLAVSSANAQSVDSLVEEALRNNPQFTSFDYQIQGAEIRARAAQALPAPTLGVEFSQIPTSSGNVFNDAISNNLSLSQMFMLGGKLSAMSEVEQKKGRVLEQNRESFGVQLRARIKMEYARLWLVDRQVEVQKNTISLLQELVRLTASRVQTNRMRQADLLTVQAEASSEESKLVEMGSRRTTIQNSLVALIGRDDFSTAIVTDSALSSGKVAMSGFELTEALNRTNPALLAMDRMREMNESEITAAGKGLIPDLMVQAMAMRMPNGMVLTSGSRSASALQQSMVGMPMNNVDWMYSIMVSITLPFAPWSAERSTGKADEMRALNASIEAEKTGMRRDMIASLASAINRYAVADSLAEMYSATIIPLLREAADAQTMAYHTGQVPITTVLDARRMELMKQHDYLMALADRQMAFAEIEMMVGKPIY
jgi:cobalt-zinc-cadmium efflux system outer membrane protein